MAGDSGMAGTMAGDSLAGAMAGDSGDELDHIRERLSQPRRSDSDSDVEWLSTICRVDRGKPWLWRVDRHMQPFQPPSPQLPLPPPPVVFARAYRVAANELPAFPRAVPVTSREVVSSQPVATRLSQPSSPTMLAGPQDAADGWSWHHSTLSIRAGAELEDLRAVVLHAAQGLPIDLEELRFASADCEETIARFTALRATRAVYIGTTSDVKRRWLGSQSDDGAYFNDDGSKRRRVMMSGHCTNYDTMYILAILPSKIARFVEPHLIAHARRLCAAGAAVACGGSRCNNVAEDARGMAHAPQCLYCVVDVRGRLLQ